MGQSAVISSQIVGVADQRLIGNVSGAVAAAAELTAAQVTTFLSLGSTYVPYTGATSNVNLGSYTLTAGGATISGQFANAGGTITASTPVTFTQTWNNAAVQFTGIDFNVTQTAQAGGSLFLNLKASGTSKFRVDKDGYTYGYTFYGIGSATTSGMFPQASSVYFYAANAASAVIYSDGTLSIGGPSGTGVDLYGTLDKLNLRRSTNAQKFQIENTYTSSTNREYGEIGWTSNEWRIGTAVGSAGGTQRSLVLGHWNSSSTFTGRLWADPNGAIGIGGAPTTSSQTTLHIQNDYARGILINNSTIGTAVTNGLYIGCNSAGNAYLYNQTTGSLDIGTSDNVQVSISSAGAISLTPTALSGSSATSGLTLTQTWNTTGTPTLISANVTDTASNASSLLMDLQVGGTSKFKVEKDGGITFTGDSGLKAGGNIRVWSTGGSSFIIRNSSNSQTRFNVDTVSGTVTIRNSSNQASYLSSLGADNLAAVNGATAQCWDVSNTYTSSTNFEVLRSKCESNEARIGTAVGSAGGTQRSLVLGTWNSAGTWTAGITLSASSLYYQTDGSTTKNLEVNSSVGAALRWANTSLVLNSAQINLTPGSQSSGSSNAFTYTGPSSTGLTASTEVAEVLWTMPTKTWASGALTTQRFFRITQPTIAFSGASTVTTAVTLDIGGAPVAGTNATITTSLGLRVAGGALIGTSTSDKFGLWNATPIVQPTTGVAAATLVSNGGTTLTDTDTFDGYTLKQIVKALRNIGALA